MIMTEHEYDETRLAFALAIQIMAEDAADCDGFTDRQIELIEEYAPLVGIELKTVRDSHGEDMYQLTPKPSEIVAEIKRVRDYHDARREQRETRQAIWIVICFSLFLLTLMLIAAYFAIFTNGGR